MKRLMTSVFALLLTASATATAADGRPAHYPERFHLTGVVYRVDLENRELVINDTSFYLASTLRVATPGKANGTVNLLRSGQRVGVRLAPGTSGKSLAGIWLLP